MTAHSHLGTWMGFAGLTMSLGWGLRGYIGGGPLGAMIPGALVALALCLLLRREDADVGVIAAFGAVGVGFGGQMTYGQTIGLSKQAETMAWGLLGLGIKGAVWGLLGGALIGLALVRRQYRQRDLLIAFALLVTGTAVGWALINEPKLIYFSNRYDRPRSEVWAGLLVGALALLVFLSRRSETRIPHHFAAASLVGGSAGFFLGGWLQVWGLSHFPHPWIDWWKAMEFTFGLLLGMALGGVTWRHRDELRAHACDRPPERSALSLLLILALAVATFADLVRLRFAYTVLGALLLAVSSRPTRACWHIAITMTTTAFLLDLLGVPAAKDIPWRWIAVAAAVVVTAVLVDRFPQPVSMYLFLLLLSVADSVAKSLLQRASGAHLWVEVVFVAMLAALLGWVWRLQGSRVTLGTAVPSPSVPLR